MIEQASLTPRFVDLIPRDLEEGVIYASIKYATVIHSCCCGCGNRVVTPLSPVQWKLIFDGRSISLDPSIGNGNFPCRSHYWITNNRVVWARRHSQYQIEAVRENDARAAAEYFDKDKVETERASQTAIDNRQSATPKAGIFGRILRWFGA